MFNNFQYSDIYLHQLQESKSKIDKIITEKMEDGDMDNVERLKLEQQRFLAPLFDMSFSWFGQYRNPW